MVPENADMGVLFSRPDRDLDIERRLCVRFSDFANNLLQIGVQLAQKLRTDVRKDLQLAVGISADDTGADSGPQTLSSAGVRHDHALDVLDDISADNQLDLFGKLAEGLAGEGAGIGNGDGFRAAHCRDQLPLENGDIAVIELLIHGESSCSLRCDIIPGMNVRGAGSEDELPDQDSDQGGKPCDHALPEDNAPGPFPPQLPADRGNRGHAGRVEQRKYQQARA